MAPYSILGTGLWATTFSLLGYFASKNIEAVLSNSEHALLAFAVIVALVVGVTLLVRFMREPENRSKIAAWMDARPVFRTLMALARRLQPQAQFVAGRLTPGGLGLELTTALAALAVGSYIFIAYALFLGDNPGPTAGDTAAQDIAESIRTGWLTTVAKIVTFMGSGWAVGAASLITAGWLAYRRYWMELVILVVGCTLTLICPSIAKEAVDRPRPENGLVDAAGSAYPSGHATHAIDYVWIAIVVSLRSRAGITRGAAIVTAGIVAAAAIGLSRVYLGVHWLSDVSGGWALGVSIFALIVTIALVVAFIRQDGRRDVA
jgi:undecaprenyl-diphosphatase